MSAALAVTDRHYLSGIPRITGFSLMLLGHRLHPKPDIQGRFPFTVCGEKTDERSKNPGSGNGNLWEEIPPPSACQNRLVALLSRDVV
jgi:hypothetical protein